MTLRGDGGGDGVITSLKQFDAACDSAYRAVSVGIEFNAAGICLHFVVVCILSMLMFRRWR